MHQLYKPVVQGCVVLQHTHQSLHLLQLAQLLHSESPDRSVPGRQFLLRPRPRGHMTQMQPLCHRGIFYSCKEDIRGMSSVQQLPSIHACIYTLLQ